MQLPSRTIWDTRIQCVCGLLCARGEHGNEVFFSANFAPVTLDPPRIAINPNRLYPIEPAIRRAGRFSLTVLPESALAIALAVGKLHRRQPDKAATLRLPVEVLHYTPYYPAGLETLFCEVESVLSTGDHTLMVARVVEVVAGAGNRQAPPLLYADVLATEAPPRVVRRLLARTGAMDALKRLRARLRPPPAADLPGATYRIGGQTETELSTLEAFGLLDGGRVLRPPAPARVGRQPIGICVVGTNWGSFHARLVREANPAARLFVCGQDEAKTARLARAVKADGYFVGLERALHDERVQAVALALPHHLHRDAACLALNAGRQVLVEKPIATTLADADAMIDCARRNGGTLMVAEDMHFRPAVAEAVRAIERGDLGQPLYLLAHAGGIRRPQGWAARKELMGGGVLMDIGVHYVRALRLIMGEPDRAMATGAMPVNTKMSGEDSAQVLFSSRAGWQAHMLLTWASNRGNVPDIVVAGEKATLHLWAGKPYMDIYPAAPLPLTRLVSLVRPYSLQARLTHPNMQRIRMKVPAISGYLAEYREFFAAIEENRPSVSTAPDARRDVEIVLRAYEALETGGWVEI